MHSILRSAVARWSFAPAKDGSQNVRDNNAARVAGPGRICFYGPRSLRKDSGCGPRLPSAAKAVDENRPLIAAVNRCATQNQAQHRVFPQVVQRWETWKQ